VCTRVYGSDYAKIKELREKNPNKVIHCWKFVKVDNNGDFIAPFRNNTYIKDKNGFIQAVRLGKKLETTNLSRKQKSDLYRYGNFEINFGVHAYRTRKLARENKKFNNVIVKVSGLVKDLIGYSTSTSYWDTQGGIKALAFTKVKMPTSLKEAKKTKTLSR